MAGDFRYYAEVLEECVRLSAATFDQEWPGWNKEVDEFRLDMRSPSNCLLAQFYGSYTLGKKALHLISGDTVRRGFCPKGQKLTAENLKRAWLEMAKERNELRPPPGLRGMYHDGDYGWEIITGRTGRQAVR
ncbi:MAG: hypothetical protein Q8R39_01305 [bacterium]|nr:hypothetical protein [bacterium]MDZ4284719.1 hypothetical protein [Patescibacteria group bacterium]